MKRLGRVLGSTSPSRTDGQRDPRRRRRRHRVVPLSTYVPQVVEVDLASYDVIEVSTSAGKDSLAMLARIARAARAAGVLNRVVAVHADLGRFEWPGTKRIAEEQARHLGVRFIVVQRPQGDFFELVRRYGYWPKPNTRYCTAMLKRGQLIRAMTELADEMRNGWSPEAPRRPVRVLNCIGLRAQESPGRAAKSVLARDARASSGRKHVDIYLPIQHLTEKEVWAECHASGAPIHPAYAAGLPRASCVFCFYAPYEALVVAGRAHPELLAEYVTVEKEIGHDFKHHLPLAKIQADIAAGVQVTGPVPNWCM